MEAFQTLMLKWRRSDQSFTPNELGLIKSQGKLIKIARDSKDNPTRVAAVRLLTDQKVLAEVALNEKDYRTRFAAVEQLADQSVLAEVAINDKESKIRYAAVKRITDQRALAEVVVNGQYDVLSKPVCGWAAGRIKDQDILIEMVKSDKWYQYLREITRMIKDKGVLAEIARDGSKSSSIRQTVVAVLSDQRVLAEIARNDENPRVRGVAVERIKNQSVLAEVARNDEDSQVRLNAIKRIQDQCTQAEIILHEKEVEVRLKAVESYIMNKNVLAEIAKKDDVSEVRREAMRRIYSNVLTEIVRNDQSEDVRYDAVSVIGDTYLLRDIVSSDQSVKVQNAAREKLQGIEEWQRRRKENLRRIEENIRREKEKRREERPEGGAVRHDEKPPDGKRFVPFIDDGYYGTFEENEPEESVERHYN